ncbi:Fic family protein [Aeromicrobium sp. Root236]|uniref:Fic family protein n=1 Tax=Aeromicrobium sp. Root236 TaxID=1736498 RepID=UPI0019101030|nr:Fic/DOC family N-terminal domain-containing protein [Aeromicrobium sp. Root236]
MADARAALGALDSTARQLPNPQLLRQPTLRKEAQSTSALEGTYAPLDEVLAADENEPTTGSMREVLNYVEVAETAFAWQREGRPLSVTSLCQLQGRLVRGTVSATPSSGNVRDIQVVIGHRADAPIEDSRFVPMPPGSDLEARYRDLVEWIAADHSQSIDPVIGAAMVHYQFETLHPYNDGNGRIGRLIIVLQFLMTGVLTEPTLTVSPWFEARREEYYNHLLSVSATGEWDPWVRFFAEGIKESAAATQKQMLALVRVQAELHERVRASSLRADSAHAVVDHSVGHVAFTVRGLEQALNVSYGRANKLVAQLIEIGVLAPFGPSDAYRRRFHAPDVMSVLLRS